jgi:hypothetical protein
MRLAVSVTKAAEHRVGERSPENFLNSLEDVKQYMQDYDVAFFTNIRGCKCEKGIKPMTFKEAYANALESLSDGYDRRDVFISAILNKTATVEDIDF